MGAKIAEQEQRVTALEARFAQGLEPLTGISQQLTEQGLALGQITQRLGHLDQTLAGQTQKTSELEQALAGQTKQIGTYEQRLAGLEKQIADQSPEAMTAGLRVVAADRVIDALREGSPFPQAFAALRRLTPQAPALKPLEAFASSGAPTAAVLSEEWKPLGQRIVAEARGPAHNVADGCGACRGGRGRAPLERRRLDSAPGLVARIENALDRGALQEAAAAWDALPSRLARRRNRGVGS
jgi:hypothetical protein